MKRFNWLLIGLLVLCLAMIPLAGCGISKSEHETLQADYEALQTENASLVGENTTLKAELDGVESDLTKAQADYKALQTEHATLVKEKSSLETELEGVQSDLTKSQAEHATLVKEKSNLETELRGVESDLTSAQGKYDESCVKLEQGKARIEVLNAIFIPAITGELDGMTEAEALAYFLKWRDKVNTIGDAVLTTHFEAIISELSDEASIAFFLYLLESIPEVLE